MTVDTKEVVRKMSDNYSKNNDIFDVVVHIAYINHIIERSPCGKSVYKKFKPAKDKTFKKVRSFTRLIKSFEKNGYDPESALTFVDYNKSLSLYSGSHRLACLLYFKIPHFTADFIDLKTFLERKQLSKLYLKVYSSFDEHLKSLKLTAGEQLHLKYIFSTYIQYG